jgi:hypothetical protein
MLAGTLMDPDPFVLLRSRGYVRLLVLAALIGIPVSAAAYGFLKLVSWLQEQLFSELPDALGFAAPPAWWPLPLLVASGFLTALAIRRRTASRRRARSRRSSCPVSSWRRSRP